MRITTTAPPIVVATYLNIAEETISKVPTTYEFWLQKPKILEIATEFTSLSKLILK